MKEDVILLKKEFRKIKALGLVEALRQGTTGVGYTFEKLLNKEEDQECKPDFKSIELKCKLGYSKSAITLFNCVPKKHNESAIKYIFEKYGYHRFGDKNDYKLFERKVFSNFSIKRFEYEFKLKVDYYSMKIVMQSYYKGVFIENVCSWDFKTLETKLKRKLTNLAIIQAYPYYRKNKKYYKYVKMNLYKLTSFFEFLKLVENDKIFVNFYMKSALGKSDEFLIKDHGVGFKIKNDCIEELFHKLRY
ncbi:MAG: hypothetical protein E7161_04220 [Firmicutes bacterium]|nr:hypothetical protein [Bacillota bacterium]